MKKIILFMGVFAFTVILLIIINESSPTKNEKVYAKENGQVDSESQKQESEKSALDDQVTELTAGGTPDPEKYLSNSHLYMAHLGSAYITHNTTFDNGGEILDKENVNTALDGIKNDLSKIEYTGEKEKDIQKAIDLTDQAIKGKTKIDDQILEDIHNVIHALSKYFNNDDIDVKVDETGIPINDEDKIPGWDYSKR